MHRTAEAHRGTTERSGRPVPQFQAPHTCLSSPILNMLRLAFRRRHHHHHHHQYRDRYSSSFSQPGRYISRMVHYEYSYAALNRRVRILQKAPLQNTTLQPFVLHVVSSLLLLVCIGYLRATVDLQRPCTRRTCASGNVSAMLSRLQKTPPQKPKHLHVFVCRWSGGREGESKKQDRRKRPLPGLASGRLAG